MPKKRETPKKKKENKSKQESSKKIKIDESMLEKEVEEVEEKKEDEQKEFNEFIESSPQVTAKAPILEKVRAMERIQEIELPSAKQETTERRIDYVAKSNAPKYSVFGRTGEEEEKKYESVFIPPVLSRREMRATRTHELLRPSEQMLTDENNPSLQFVEWENFEDSAGLPFEKQEKKYKKFRL